MPTACHSRSELNRRAAWVLLGLALAAIVPLEALVEMPSVCLFRNITDLPCPGCGLTRSVVATAHLRLGEAFSFHLFGPLLVLAAGAWASMALAGRSPERIDWHRSRTLRILAATWLVWAVARIL